MTMKDDLCRTKTGRIAWQQEKALFDVGNLLCEMLNESGMTRGQLARKMKVAVSTLNMILDGDRKLLTITAASDIAYHLGMELVFGMRGAESLEEPTHAD